MKPEEPSKPGKVEETKRETPKLFGAGSNVNMLGVNLALMGALALGVSFMIARKRSIKE